MCGIAGFFDRSGTRGESAGATLLAMLTALSCRGPDSAGIALWGPGESGLIVRVKLGDGGDLSARRRDVLKRAGRAARVRTSTVEGALLRLVVTTVDPAALAAALEGVAPDVEVVSMGRRLQIVKQVGAPARLDTEFGVGRWAGTHGLGHTRLSTESRVDLSHSQPFWAHGTPDLAVVHNGHITNYHRLRRIYEQDGVRFYTENDSEIIGVYLARQMAGGRTLREALAASVGDLDGSFSYLAATTDAFGFAKDRFCLKPLIVGEGDGTVAIANEEVALRAALGGAYRAREAGAGATGLWEVRARPAARQPRRGRRAA